MKYIKDGIFYFIIFYIVFFSFLFIKQSITLYNTMNQEVVFETKERYEKFIVDSRNKLESYKKNASTEDDSCLLEIEEAINISYQNQHPTVSTYKELIQYYYNKDSDKLHYNYSNIIDKCNLKESDDSLKKESIRTALGNMAIIEPILLNSVSLYQLDLHFDDLITGNLTKASVESMLKVTEQTTRDRIINNEINYINSILELVGEKYENL